MSIVGERPETGMRYELRRHEPTSADHAALGPNAESTPRLRFVYRGRIVPPLPHAVAQAALGVIEDGEVIALPETPEPYRERLRLLVRPLARSLPQAEPPLVITRWRPDQVADQVADHVAGERPG
jgi:hypothetical protein